MKIPIFTMTLTSRVRPQTKAFYKATAKQRRKAVSAVICEVLEAHARQILEQSTTRGELEPDSRVNTNGQHSG